MTKLTKYNGETATAIELIKGFWYSHNNIVQTDKDASGDLDNWTKEGHLFYFITYLDDYVGFIHLGSRGNKANWLEDIFVLPNYQGIGIGSKAILLIEEIVKKYSVSMYIEAAARNQAAIRLYHKLGFDCLNTISMRKDFPNYQYDVVKREKIHDLDFEIRKNKLNEL